MKRILSALLAVLVVPALFTVCGTEKKKKLMNQPSQLFRIPRNRLRPSIPKRTPCILKTAQRAVKRQQLFITA